MNLHVDELNIANLYTTMQISKSMTTEGKGSKEGVEILKNEYYDHTHLPVGSRSIVSDWELPLNKGKHDD